MSPDEKKTVTKERFYFPSNSIKHINGDIKKLNIKNRSYYFFKDMINIEDIDSSLLKLDKKSYKNIDIYYIRYKKTKKKIDDYENIYSVDLCYLITGKVNRFIEERNKNKYLFFDFTGDENKEVSEKYTECWHGIENETETINGGKAVEYEKDFTKIKFISDDNLALNKLLKFPTMTIVVRSIFEEDDKFHLQIYIGESLNEL